MNITLFFLSREVRPSQVQGHDVVIVDTLRATSTIALAVAGKARVEPVGSVRAARARARALGARALLAGERRGIKVRGFALGNSPAELQRADVAGKVVVFTTSNGTDAVLRCHRARRIYTAALVNAPALAKRLAGRGTAGPLAFVCAGRSSGVAMEDLVGAGAVIAYMCRLRSGIALTDSARTARDLFERHRRGLTALLRTCDSGRYLRSIGAGADLRLCGQLGALEVVPRLERAQFVGV